MNFGVFGSSIEKWEGSNICILLIQASKTCHSAAISSGEEDDDPNPDLTTKRLMLNDPVLSLTPVLVMKQTPSDYISNTQQQQLFSYCVEVRVLQGSRAEIV